MPALPDRCGRTTVLQGELALVLHQHRWLTFPFSRTDHCKCFCQLISAAAWCERQVQDPLAEHCNPLWSSYALIYTCCRTPDDPVNEVRAHKRARRTAKKATQRAALSVDRAQAVRATNTAARRPARQAAHTPAPTPADRQQAQQAARAATNPGAERLHARREGCQLELQRTCPTFHASWIMLFHTSMFSRLHCNHS